MLPSKAAGVLASVATFFILSANAFVTPSNPFLPANTLSRTHVCSSTAFSTAVSSQSSSRRCLGQTTRPQGLLSMAAGGKKRKRRKEKSKNGSSASSSTSKSQLPAAAVPASPGGTSSSETVVRGAGQLGDVLEGERGIEALFSNDWSDMPANDGMVKTSVSLPDITKFKPSKRAETTLEQREKKTAVGLIIGKTAKKDAKKDGTNDGSGLDLSNFKSKLTPIVDREEERLKKSAAERFEEGPIVKGLKTATWFSILTLVLWEIYINSPFFKTPGPPPI